MKREIIKIQRGNDTTICIRALLPDGKTSIPFEVLSVDGLHVTHVYFSLNGHDTEIDIQRIKVKDGLMIVPINESMPVGKYGIHVVGEIRTNNGDTVSDIDCNFYEAFEIVPYSDNIRYDNYYTDIFIVGLPDSTYEQLRKEYEEKIAEAEEAKAYWQQQALNLDGVAKQGDNPDATNSAIYDLIYHGGGGGGGGGLTPEQWDKIAKEETLNEIKGMLAAYQTANAAKLDTIIANTSLTAAQADEDWQNIGPA